MRLSCLPVSFYPDFTQGERSLGDWFRFAAALGLDGADVSIAHLAGAGPDMLRGLRGEAADAGVVIAGMVTYTDFTHPDPDERARQVDMLRRAIETGHTLGVDFLRVTAGQAHPGVERADGVAWAVAGLLSCLDEAEAAGVQLVYENHTIGYGWTYFDFSQPADVFLEIVERAADPRLGVLFDTANNLARSEDPLAVLEQVIHRVAVVHASDIRRAGAFEPVVLGTGVAPNREVFRRLQAAGWDGWLSVEEASRTGEAGFVQAITAARRMWSL
ncbi:MAG: sugar phosphate isomerase/epimerase [Caldilineae bacterium]|nr:MAG: sugar phosphate isomerase/epimerase [Caldilineae bacterium]